MKKFESSKPFFRGEEMEWEIVDNGIKRKIMGYDDKIMLVHVLFEKGAIGSTHEHYHSQVSYVGSGVFDITIDGLTQKLKKEILSMYHQILSTEPSALRLAN